MIIKKLKSVLFAVTTITFLLPITTCTMKRAPNPNTEQTTEPSSKKARIDYYEPKKNIQKNPNTRNNNNNDDKTIFNNALPVKRSRSW